jgi:preprotein translocase subunit SecE
MGRIQRKKAPGARKKKKQNAANETAPKIRAESSISDQKLGQAESSGKEAKNKQALSPKKPQAAPVAAVGKKPPTFLNTAIQFLREVKIELKKVTWPSRKQTIGSTVVVIVIVIIISLFLGVVDLGLSSLIRVVLQ